MDILSTRAVAEMIGVSEATVKRWADAGTLRCFRTAGGHRKFRVRDVKAFLADQPVDDHRPPPPPPSRDLTPEQVQVRALALAGDVDGLVSLVATWRLKGTPLPRVFDEVLAPALNDLGDGWACGNLSPAQEHVASNAVLETLARIRPLVERAAKRDRGQALCACMGDERHDIALRMAALVLAAEGFAVVLSGASTPANDLAVMIASQPPALVALSASCAARSDDLRGDLGVVASAATAARSHLFVGGQGFASLTQLPSHVKRFGTLEELVSVTRFDAVPVRT